MVDWWDLEQNPSCADTGKRRVVGAAEGERQGELDGVADVSEKERTIDHPR